MNKLITLMAILANICGGALLVFHLLEFMPVTSEQVEHAVRYFFTIAAALVLIVGVADDIFHSNRRPFGIAIFLVAVWVAFAPSFALDSLREQARQFIPNLIKHQTVILCLYLLILARLSAFGQRQPLGYALGLLVGTILCLDGRFSDAGPHADVFYYGLVSTMAGFVVMLGLGSGYQNVSSWAMCILLALLGAYHVVS